MITDPSSSPTSHTKSSPLCAPFENNVGFVGLTSASSLTRTIGKRSYKIKWELKFTLWHASLLILFGLCVDVSLLIKIISIPTVNERLRKCFRVTGHDRISDWRKKFPKKMISGQSIKTEYGLRVDNSILSILNFTSYIITQYLCIWMSLFFFLSFIF